MENLKLKEAYADGIIWTRNKTYYLNKCSNEELAALYALPFTEIFEVISENPKLKTHGKNK